MIHFRGLTARRPDERRAFTLIEMICVVVILGIMATVMVPRVVNTGVRNAELEAQGVQRLLTVAGQKVELWSQPVAIDFTDSRLTLWTRRADTGAAADAVGAATARWRRDPLVESVTLSNLKIAQATTDNIVLPRTQWRIELTPGQPRPVVAITLESVKNAAVGWRVALDPESSAASRVTTGAAGGANTLSPVARSIDLDDAGKGTAPW